VGFASAGDRVVCRGSGLVCRRDLLESAGSWEPANRCPESSTHGTPSILQRRDLRGDADERLEAVLGAYALISHHREHHGTEVAALLHRGKHVARAQQQLIDLVRDLLTEVAETGDLRDDVAPDEIASYCLHALTAASSLPSRAAVRWRVTVNLAGLRPPALTRPDAAGAGSPPQRFGARLSACATRSGESFPVMRHSVWISPTPQVFVPVR